MSVAEALDEIDYFVKVVADAKDSIIVTFPGVGLYVENDEEYKEGYTLLDDGFVCYNFQTHIEEKIKINQCLIRPIITSNIIKRCVQKGLNISLIRYYKTNGVNVKNLTEIFDYPVSDSEALLCEAAFELILSGTNETTQNKIDECGLTISFNILKGFLL